MKFSLAKLIGKSALLRKSTSALMKSFTKIGLKSLSSKEVHKKCW